MSDVVESVKPSDDLVCIAEALKGPFGAELAALFRAVSEATGTPKSEKVVTAQLADYFNVLRSSETQFLAEHGVDFGVVGGGFVRASKPNAFKARVAKGVRRPRQKDDTRGSSSPYEPRLQDLIKGLLVKGYDLDSIHVDLPKAEDGNHTKYFVVTINGLDKQIAVCNRSNKITLVSDDILPLETWQNSSLGELQAMECIFAVRKISSWIDDITDFLQGDKSHAFEYWGHSSSRRHEALTDDMLVGHGF